MIFFFTRTRDRGEDVVVEYEISAVEGELSMLRWDSKRPIMIMISSSKLTNPTRLTHRIVHCDSARCRAANGRHMQGSLGPNRTIRT